MVKFGILLIIIGLWIAFEMWRAPLMEEKSDGRLVEKKPAKKLLDLFKRNNKNK